MEKDCEWLLPENLKMQEQKERVEVEQGTFDGRGDFGSYYAYRKGINRRFIETHAQVDESWAEDYAKSLKSYLNAQGVELSGRILDVGCAIGTITNAIQKINKKMEAVGLDISQDAIEVAKAKYPQCTFYRQSADDLSNFPNDYFEIIHAREFYPFTRTNDRFYQLHYLNSFYQKLKRGGATILQMVHLERGFGHTYRQVENELKRTGYMLIKRDVMISLKLFRIFRGWTYRERLYELFFVPLNNLLVGIRGGEVGYYYLLRKS